MRLTQINLAGFKSFVDPTHIPVPGKLVGVVGPNGCGKSNIIDAVRWVLGETSARHLRGETMQDVLFNGSIGRTDLPGGDHETLLASIRDKVLPLGDEVSFICGHGPGSTIGQERLTNPFLTGMA